MERLTVLTDANCTTCRRVAAWVERQRAYLPIEIIPADAAEARERFPGLDPLAMLGDLTVVSDVGEVWQGPGAWITILWALEAGRTWSFRLASPLLWPLARRLIELASRERMRLGAVAAMLGPDPLARLQER
ncbi:MAG: DCC1-like thiol-disulfide oxidoreductase family protein [Planctomycetota bacterium]|nr:DCC1-like thiol-disulfide oxidoreductase family protein [Planctomycetota bacterium]